MRSLTSDPTTLAEAPTIDEAAALAAAEAAAAAAALEVGTKAPGSIDSFARAVLRRYEPPTAEASTKAVQVRSGKPLSASTHWALSGLPQKPETAGAAAKPAAPPAAKPAAPASADAAPKCLEGVRRVLSGKAVSEKTPGC
jgi:hypothetical protein